MLESAENNLRSAKQLLGELTGLSFGSDYTKQAEVLKVADGGRVIEGVFDGKDMIGPDKRQYPVPANYASKSKLVAGDILKLTITEDGSYIYKQIGPTARRKMIGTLTQEGNQYKVLAGGRSYSVLLASVTYFKAQPGDQVSIIVPESEDAEWAAVDNFIVKPEGGKPTEVEPKTATPEPAVTVEPEPAASKSDTDA